MFFIVLGAIALGFVIILLLPKSTPPVIVEQDSLASKDERVRALERVEGDTFLHLCLAFIQQLGLEVHHATQVNEREWDIVAERAVPIVGGSYLIQCVLSTEGSPLDLTKVRLLHDMVKAEGFVKGILITNGYFTQDALQAYIDAPIELINCRRFQQLLEQYHLW